MSEQVGVFPLGPSPAMQAEIYRQRQIIKALVGGLLILRWQISHRMTEPVGSLSYEQERAFWTGVGESAKNKCIICGEDRGAGTSDLDCLFCSKHCPVCSDWEATLDD